MAVIVKKRAESVIRHFPGRRGRLEPALPVLSEVEGSEVEGCRPKFFKIYCIFQKIYFFKKLYILCKFYNLYKIVNFVNFLQVVILSSLLRAGLMLVCHIYG